MSVASAIQTWKGLIPVAKISKKNQDPNQVHKDAAALAELSAIKSQHFAVGTGVVSNNVRGTVMSDDGTNLWIAWDDGIYSSVRKRWV